MNFDSIQIVDSHTGGEPTRVVIDGGPDLGTGPLDERRKIFSESFDEFRQSLMREPRGNDVIVGALLCEPYDSSCEFGVIYFNNVGYIGMCGHGTIGLITTLYDLGRIRPGVVKIDTPVGPVEATLHEDLSVSVTNVPSYRYRQGVVVEVPGFGTVTGDIAWGGNWFFLVKDSPIAITQENIAELTSFSLAVRKQLDQQKISGKDGGLIDHIELFGPPNVDEADSKNFVLCPGGEFDRSPCGTGTSAKLACLYSQGQLKAGEIFRQESIVGSVFEASFEELSEGVISPTIRGRAHIHATSTIRLQADDPFRLGIAYRNIVTGSV